MCSECRHVAKARDGLAPPGFEPGTSAPKAEMIDRYTTGL